MKGVSCEVQGGRKLLTSPVRSKTLLLHACEDQQAYRHVHIVYIGGRRVEQENSLLTQTMHTSALVTSQATDNLMGKLPTWSFRIDSHNLDLSKI